ncbi:MAG: hypothetical protein ACRDI3_04230 [Actinomycetota bacterium]
MSADVVPTVLLTGTVGSGKTAVAEEVGTLLHEARIPRAMIDLDWLCQLSPAPENDPYAEELMLRNLGLIWPSFRDGGAQYLVLARVIERREHLARYREVVPEADITVVRALASQDTIRRRLQQREIGSYFEPMWARSKELASILDQAQAEDFTVSNDERPLREVATEVLKRLEWPTP